MKHAIIDCLRWALMSGRHTDRWAAASQVSFGVRMKEQAIRFYYDGVPSQKYNYLNLIVQWQ